MGRAAVGASGPERVGKGSGMDLSGRVVVVTGGTRGVGAGIAGAFARAGARVIICARRPPEEPLDGCEFIPVDLRDAAAVEELFAGLDRVDVLVNNAGARRTARSPRRTRSGTHACSN